MYRRFVITLVRTINALSKITSYEGSAFTFRSSS
jgi:hypothetical protein